MPVELRVPQMGESISEATVLIWLKKEGDTFAAGDDLVELETDKANSAISADQAGVLSKIVHPEGDTVGPNDVLAILSEIGTGAPTSAPALERASPLSTDKGADNGRAAPHTSPLAARVAAAQGVDLSQVHGSGVGGRIMSEDVQKAAESVKGDTASPATVSSPIPTITVPSTTQAAEPGALQHPDRLGPRHGWIAHQRRCLPCSRPRVGCWRPSSRGRRWRETRTGAASTAPVRRTRTTDTAS